MYAQSKTGINGLFRKYEALPDIPKMFYHDLVNTSFNITNAVYFFKDSILTYPIQVKRWCELTGKIINESLKKVEELKRRLSDYFPPNP